MDCTSDVYSDVYVYVYAQGPTRKLFWSLSKFTSNNRLPYPEFNMALNLRRIPSVLALAIQKKILHLKGSGVVYGAASVQSSLGNWLNYVLECACVGRVLHAQSLRGCFQKFTNICLHVPLVPPLDTSTPHRALS